ncbi:MAG: tetratricopeptide repeat protein [Candidatus Nitrospinota bacterium M3_3B_026]
MDDKEKKALLAKYAKKRVTLIIKDRNERKQVKNALRENGINDIVELDDFSQAWSKLQLTATNVLVFSVSEQEGLDFLSSVEESARFKKTPLIVFTNKPREHPGLFSGEDLLIYWEELPMNGYKVENRLLEVFEKGVVEKSLLGRDHDSLEHYSQAVDALAEEKFEDAKELLRISLKESPEFFEAYVKMVEALTGLGDLETARRVLGRAEKMRPAHPKVLILKARLAAELENKENAVRVFDAVVGARPRDLMFVIGIGNIALEKGWVDEAIHYYEIAKNIDPELIHAYNRLGMAHSRAGRFDEALAMYDKALKIDDEDAGIHFNIGMAYTRKGEKERAIEYFKKASALDPRLTEPKEWAEKLEAGG